MLMSNIWGVRRTAHWRKAMKRLGLSVILLVGLSACQARDFSTSNRSEVVLRINKVGAASPASDFLLSDVETDGSVFNDNATVILEAVSKNPLVGNLTAVSDVFLTTYTVKYTRSDGRNVEGIDVPYAISGSLSTIVPVGGTSTIAFIVVRHQAKEEPPLKAMRGDGLAGDIVTTIATITIYGKTTSGKDVSAVGYLDITFADFGDA
jgi:hypothetical protein